MALGGGSFVSQNKTLPGSYINFVSAARAAASLSERGVAALPAALDWGPEGTVLEVTAQDFQTDTRKLFGYRPTAPELKGLRDLFQNARLCYLYRVDTGGKAAENDFAKAKYPGTAGNKITVVVTANEAATAETPLYDVETLFDGAKVDEQKGVADITALAANDFLLWKSGAALALTAGTPLAGGTSGTAAEGNFQDFLDKIESYSFNCLCLPSDSSTLKQLFANFTRRMREEVGAKFQCVLYGYPLADHEGVISVDNAAGTDAGDARLDGSPAYGMVYWTAGAEAGCAVNKTLTNATYTGEYKPDTGYTQAQLETSLKSGKLLFHRVGSEIRVLEDVNTFTSFSEEKGTDFSSNQTMRVLDQIGNDIAALFNSKYLGKIPNNASGRVSFWNDIVKHHQQLEMLGAIENFSSDSVKVNAGDSKKAIQVEDHVTPVNAMAQLYMTVTVA